ncbi:COP9 signalosome protein [Salix suchowensis]|nr:COP9 signalosome protein [Salix suchowensis]
MVAASCGLAALSRDRKGTRARGGDAELHRFGFLVSIDIATAFLVHLFGSLCIFRAARTSKHSRERKDSLPPLNQAQTVKLKYLSIVTLASERRALDMPSIRELEDLIIDAIYLDILRGKLDQKEEQLEVEYTMGRDLELGKLETVLEALKDWHSTTAAVLTTLDEKLVSISSAAALRRLNERATIKS